MLSSEFVYSELYWQLRSREGSREYQKKILCESQELANKRSAQDRKEYADITERIPEDAPANLGAYRRMKKAHSERFKTLAKKAAAAGIEIKEFPDPDPYAGLQIK